MARLLLPIAAACLVAVPCVAQSLPPYGPPMPPQFPRTYEIRHMAQPYDHFNLLTLPAAGGTWNQRYLYNDSFWPGPPAPILFYCGAEGSGVETIWDHSGWIVDTLARNLSALIIFAEHRYFGDSFPFGPEESFIPDAGHVGLLSLEQSLQDYATLITFLRDSLKAWDSPLVAVGGSLAGEITTWMRVRYPFIVDMGIAASAPVLGYPGLADQYTWYHSVTETFRSVGGDECVDSVRAGFWQVPLLSLPALTQAFNTCTPADDLTAPFITGLVFGWAGGAAESSYPNSSALSPVKWGCDAMAGAPNGTAAFAALLASPDGQCLNISTEAVSALLQQQRRRGPRSGRLPLALRAALEAGLQSANSSLPVDTNGWDYLSCTEEVHPIGTNNVTDMFPPGPWSVAATQAWCQGIYGPLLSLRPDVLPGSFGLLDLPRFAATTSRLIFSSGTYDPWMTQSINATLTATLPAVVITGGAHHSDLGGPQNPVPTPDDSPSLVAARAFEIDTINAWIRAWHAERSAIRGAMRSLGWGSTAP